MGPLDPSVLADVAPLRKLRGADLRALGRLPVPMLRRHGEPGFTPISWDEALDLTAARIRESGAERCGFYLTSRGMSNESYYVAQKAVRAIGTNSIDNAARVCHSPSTFALKEAVGVAATTCSYSDWIGTDLIVFIGSNVANNQPVTTKYLHLAKKAGTKVVVVNPYREPGMERYWIPSTPESALFGTKIADRFFQINTGGDLGFLVGTLTPHDRARAGSTRSSSRPHARAGRRRARRALEASLGGPRGGRRDEPRRDGGLRRAARPGRARRARLEHGRHPARASARTTSARSSTSRSPAAGSAARAPG